MFEDSKKQMEKNKKLIMEMCGLDENSKGPTPQRVLDFKTIVQKGLTVLLYFCKEQLFFLTGYTIHTVNNSKSSAGSVL